MGGGLKGEVPHDAVDGVHGCGEGEGVEEGVLSHSELEVIDGCSAICVSRAGGVRARSCELTMAGEASCSRLGSSTSATSCRI